MHTKHKDEYIKMGLKIQYYRKLRGLTQEAFAEGINKSWSFIAQIESTSLVKGISLETLFDMAQILQVPPHKLLDND